MKQLIKIGQMNNLKDHTFEINNRVYSSKGISPAITTCSGGGAAEYNKKNVQQEHGRFFTKGKLLNSETDGTCRTIKANYYKVSVANFTRGNTFGATGVIRRKAYEAAEKKESQNDNSTERSSKKPEVGAKRVRKENKKSIWGGT